jgi:glycerol kinase
MNVLMQFQADLLGVPVRRPQVVETTAMGAAYLAGLATGVWSSREEIARQWRLDAEFRPRDDGLEHRYTRWQAAVERARAWAEP